VIWQGTLCMLTSKKIQNLIKCMSKHKNTLRFVRFVSLMAIFLFVYCTLDFLMADDSSTNRLGFHDYYSKDNIDVAVVGASKVYNGFDPQLANNLLNRSTFNLGTASQPLSATYYRTKELLNDHTVDTLFVDVEFSDLSRTLEGGKATWIVTDYMKGIEKFELALAHGSIETKLATLFPIFRNRDKLSIDFLKQNYTAKSCKEYIEYLPENPVYSGYGNYKGDGFNLGVKANPGYQFLCYPKEYNQFDQVTEPDPTAMDYLQKIVDLCKEKNTRLILISMPVSQLYLSQVDDYSYFQDYITVFTQENQIEYYNLNLCSDHIWLDSDFVNLDHLSFEGAQKATRIICDLYQKHDVQFAENLEEVQRDDLVGILYTAKRLDNNLLHLEWEYISKDSMDSNITAIVKVKNEAGDYIFSSNYISEPQIDLPIDMGSSIDLFVYSHENYIGNANFQKLDLNE